MNMAVSLFCLVGFGWVGGGGWRGGERERERESGVRGSVDLPINSTFTSHKIIMVDPFNWLCKNQRSTNQATTISVRVTQTYQLFDLPNVKQEVKHKTSAWRQKGLTGYCFKYIDRPFCLRTNEK